MQTDLKLLLIKPESQQDHKAVAYVPYHRAILNKLYLARYLGLYIRTNARNFMFEFKTIALFAITAIAEIVGCYLPYLWLKQDKSILLLIPAALSLALFAWLLTLHPTATGRVYAAYGGVYIFIALLWLWVVDGVKPTMWDIVGGVVALVGMAIIMFAPKNA